MSVPSLGMLYLEDLEVGSQFVSPARTVTEADVVHFAGLSGDYNPLHTDHHAARNGPFGRPVAHGLLGMAIASGLASQAPRVRTFAFVSILHWEFRKPIAFGDTIHVEATIEAIVPQARGRRGLVTWHRRLVNQEGITVQEGRIQTLVQAASSLK